MLWPERSGKILYQAAAVSLGEVNGYVEEMINGQKVVKVFCHEEQAKAGFDDEINGELCANATEANSIRKYPDADYWLISGLSFALL